MRTLFMVVASATLVALDPGSAAAQCRPFSTDPACVRAAQPGLKLDFWGQANAKPKPKTTIDAMRDQRQSALAALAAQRAREQPMDCRMLMRRADPNVDGRMLTTPSSNVEYLIQTRPVPPCADR